MAQDMKKMIERLNDLIALDFDAVGAYQAAIHRIDVAFVKDRLTEFQRDHERHIRELSQVVQRLGGTPRSKPDVKGFILKGFTAATSAMGNEAALQAMRGNEMLTNRTYKNALDESWPEEIRTLIQRNYTDEQRHLAYIEMTLQNRAWEQHAAQP